LPAVLNNLAVTEVVQDPDSALLLIKRALDLAPKSASLLDIYGWVLAEQGKYDDALLVLRQAYSMYLNDPSIRYHLAYTLKQLASAPEAKAEIEQALALDQVFYDEDEAKALLESM
jgi:Flp pilus assembly protein TadD